MKYRTTRLVSRITVTAGLVLGAATLVSTLVSLAKGIYAETKQASPSSINLANALADLIESLAASTTILNLFWEKSPTFNMRAPLSGENFSFLLIYSLFFFSIAMLAYGMSLRNKLKYINSIVEEEKIRRAVRELGDLDGADLNKVNISNSSWFDYFVKLFLLPLVVGVLVVVLGAYALAYLGLN